MGDLLYIKTRQSREFYFQTESAFAAKRWADNLVFLARLCSGASSAATVPRFEAVGDRASTTVTTKKKKLALVARSLHNARGGIPKH